MGCWRYPALLPSEIAHAAGRLSFRASFGVARFISSRAMPASPCRARTRACQHAGDCNTTRTQITFIYHAVIGRAVRASESVTCCVVEGRHGQAPHQAREDALLGAEGLLSSGPRCAFEGVQIRVSNVAVPSQARTQHGWLCQRHLQLGGAQTSKYDPVMSTAPSANPM